MEPHRSTSVSRRIRLARSARELNSLLTIACVSCYADTETLVFRISGVVQNLTYLTVLIETEERLARTTAL